MEMTPEVCAGQAIYTKTILALYDSWVLGFSNALLWKCPTSHLETHFTRHASPNHLDVGVGTGYYPHRCLTRAPEDQRLALLDLNPNSLTTAEERTRRFIPEVYLANVLAPLESDCPPFDSISIFYLLHCLPGSLEEKAVVFEHLLPLLTPGGTLFGATILGQGRTPNFAARKLMALYNKKGIFHNRTDDLETLTRELARRFSRVRIRTRGCVAVFSAQKPV
ncbi:MAG: class I SAM-dependent methyltransferase [Desulfobacterales bacterium]|nr:class I SAM-dependent methyltransferase [Desulfobacterales bacterium]